MQCSRARLTGKAIVLTDGDMAVIVVTHGFAVVARDISTFSLAGVLVINPWTWKA